MAVHPDTVSMLHESLWEYLVAAEWCVRYKKDQTWRDNQVGGCLGFPAAVMLFCIADTIGSFHRGDRQFTAEVDGQVMPIPKQGFQHFYVLNSAYYGQSLSGATIKRLYENFRDLLVHNAALAPQHGLVTRPDLADAFPVLEGRQVVNVDSFLSISKTAVTRFLEVAPSLVPSSQQGENINKKR